MKCGETCYLWYKKLAKRSKQQKPVPKGALQDRSSTSKAGNAFEAPQSARYDAIHARRNDDAAGWALRAYNTSRPDEGTTNCTWPEWSSNNEHPHLLALGAVHVIPGFENLLVVSGQQKQGNQIRDMGTRIKSTKYTSPEQRTQSFMSQACMKCMNPRSRSLEPGVCICMSKFFHECLTRVFHIHTHHLPRTRKAPALELSCTVPFTADLQCLPLNHALKPCN